MFRLDQATRHREAHVSEADESDFHDDVSFGFVIASEAKQSILSFCGEVDCFAPLAMTVEISNGCLAASWLLSSSANTLRATRKLSTQAAGLARQFVAAPHRAPAIFQPLVMRLPVHLVSSYFYGPDRRYEPAGRQSRLRVMRISGCGFRLEQGASMPPLC
jgi:hypothetical protein